MNKNIDEQIKENITLMSNLIEVIYDKDLTDELLEKIGLILQQSDNILPRRKHYREIMLLLKKIKNMKNLNIRNNYKFLILSDLEKRLNLLKEKLHSR